MAYTRTAKRVLKEDALLKKHFPEKRSLKERLVAKIKGEDNFSRMGEKIKERKRKLEIARRRERMKKTGRGAISKK